MATTTPRTIPLAVDGTANGFAVDNTNVVKLYSTLGLAFGAYREYHIRDAYTFLMRTYEPGDRVFMFGFSRGAYTVRAVASLVHLYGLLRPSNEATIPYAIRMMMAIQKHRTGGGDDLRHEAAVQG